MGLGSMGTVNVITVHAPTFTHNLDQLVQVSWGRSILQGGGGNVGLSLFVSVCGQALFREPDDGLKLRKNTGVAT